MHLKNKFAVFKIKYTDLRSASRPICYFKHKQNEESNNEYVNTCVVQEEGI